MIHIILGTRAQLIKMAPVMRALDRGEIPYNFIYTGQHKDTMEELRMSFRIKDPDITLYQGRDIVSIPSMVSWCIKTLFATALNKRKIFKSDKKGTVIIHGDTISTLLGALMGKVARLKVGHVESGLRSFNIFHPFPEELTRILTFKLCDYFFCPGEWAINNLKKYKGKKINTRFNTLFDSLKWALEDLNQIEVAMPQEKYCIISIHRYENMNTRNKFLSIIKIIERIAKRLKALFFLHPITEKKIYHYGVYNRLKENPQLELRPRYSYFQFIKLLYGSEFMVTDGGSNQEECSYLGKPCLLLRKVTERQEGLGENVCLSQMKDSIIDDFVNGYSTFSTPSLQEEITPSSIIVSEIKMFQNSKK